MVKFKERDVITDGVMSATIISAGVSTYMIRISTISTLEDFLGGTISVPQTTIDDTCRLVGVMEI